jgi:hypothetical protein
MPTPRLNRIRPVVIDSSHFQETISDMCIEHSITFAQVSSVQTVPKDKEVRLADEVDAASQNDDCLTMIPFNHQQRGGRRDTRLFFAT